MLKIKTQLFGLVTFVLLAAIGMLLTGCADGPLWKTGKYVPWARNQWAAEEQLADTLFSRKRKMSEAVASVINAPVEDQQRVAQSISEVVLRDPILLLRLHGVSLLGKLNCPLAVETLRNASNDSNPDIRIAAVKSWQSMAPETAIPQLQNIIGSDTNVDVRLAATRALGDFNGQQAISAASLALDDKDPALQLRAIESLQRITGESLGRDVSKWQQYVGNVAPPTQQFAQQTAVAASPVSGSQTRTASTALGSQTRVTPSAPGSQTKTTPPVPGSQTRASSPVPGSQTRATSPPTRVSTNPSGGSSSSYFDPVGTINR